MRTRHRRPRGALSLTRYPGLGLGGGASTLLVNLVSYWKLDEASGTRADTVGTNNLTDNGGVGQTAGKLGNAALFVRASSQSLTTTNTGVQFNTSTSDGTLCLWFKTTDVTLTQYLVQHPHLRLFINGGSNRLTIDDAVNSGIAVPVNLSNNTWYFVQAEWDVALKKFTLTLNNATSATVTEPTSYAPTAGTTAFGGTVGNYVDGAMDSVLVSSRKLTTDEVAKLYNGGAGLEYPWN